MGTNKQFSTNIGTSHQTMGSDSNRQSKLGSDKSIEVIASSVRLDDISGHF